MRKTKYASSLPPENYTFHPARKFQLSLNGLKSLYAGDLNKCYLVALDSQQISVLMSMLTVFPKYHWVWGLPSPRREWDTNLTNEWAEIEAFTAQLEVCLMSGCNIQDLIDVQKDIVKSNRMIVAALMGQAINFDSEPNLPNAINYSQGIRQAILGISGAIDDGMTLQELKDLIDGLDLTGTSFLDTLTDIAQILTFLILLWGPTQRVSVAFGWWDKMTMKRWQHNSLTIAAHQATSLRGIMRGITPFKEESEEEEKTLYETISNIPWLARAVVAIAEPSPAGEAALIATTIGGVVNNVYQVIKEAWGLWWNKWVNLVEEPEPLDSITAALGVIASGISNRQDAAENPGVSVTNRLDVIAEALSALNAEQLVPVLTAIQTAILSLDSMPEGSDWKTIFDDLNLTMGESMPVINVSCGSCGSSGGCGCGGGSGSGAHGPGVSGPNDSPPASVPTGSLPPGFPDYPAYNVYKCKGANVIALNLAEMLYQLSEFKGADFSQYTVFSVAQQWVAGKISLAGAQWGGILQEGANWISDKIMAFLWPYPSPLAVTLSVFADVRLLWLDDREDNVCGLYNSNDAGQARTFIQDVIDGYIDGTSYDAGTKIRAKELYKGLLTNQFLNRMFEKDGFVSTYSDTSAVDCSECDTGTYTVITGNPLSTEGANPFTVELVYAPFSGGCGPSVKRGIIVNFHVNVTIISIDGVEGEAFCSGVEKYFLYPTEGATGNFFYSENVPPENVSGVRSLALITGGGGSPQATITFSID